MKCGVFVSADHLRILFLKRSTIVATHSVRPTIDALSACLQDARISNTTLLLPESAVNTSVYTYPGFYHSKTCYDALKETDPPRHYDFCYRHDPYLKKTQVCAAFAEIEPWADCKFFTRVASLRLLLTAVLPSRLFKQLTLCIYTFAQQHHFCLSEAGIIWAYIAIDSPTLGVDELHWGMQHIQQQYTGAGSSVRVIFDASLYSLIRASHEKVHYLPLKFNGKSIRSDDMLMAYVLSRRVHELP